MTENLFRLAETKTEHQIELAQSVTTKSINAAKPLPIAVIRESLEIDETVKSGLRWKTRPRHHFSTERAWKKSNTQFSGKPAGKHSHGTIYFQVKINGMKYMSHRIIYLLVNGVDPAEKQIDHIDPAISLPNVASNLRLATNMENCRNRKKRSNNTSNVPGVHWSKMAMRWRSYITINHRRIWFGSFANKADAVAARKAAEIRYFGEFAYDASRKSL